MITQLEIKAGTGMLFDDPLDTYTCKSCGHEYLTESVKNGLLFYCVNCDPIAYKENGEPYLVRAEQKISTTHGNEGGEI